MNLNPPRTLLLVAVITLLAAASPARAQNGYKCQGNSDSANWTATPAAVSINVGSSGSLGVNMTSPMCLNTYPNFPGSLPLYTDVGLDSAVCPDGSSGSVATCSLTAPVASIAGNPQVFTDFGQTQAYTVQFDASKATVGTYTFHLHANASDPDQTHRNGDNLGGIGWGYGGGEELTVTVADPKPTCDSNDVLNVSFSQPQSTRVTFCNGGTHIPVSVSASDTSNVISTLAVAVNGTAITNSLSAPTLKAASASIAGDYTVPGVGAYIFEADAATQCTTGSASLTVDVLYNISGLLGPLANGQKPKKGHIVPIQFNPKDCAGNPVPQDGTVEVKVLSSTLTMDATATGCSGSGCGSGASSYVTYDPANGYQANFTTGATPAAYAVQIWFGGVLNYSTTFITQ